jgi:hypothetical protein
MYMKKVVFWDLVPLVVVRTDVSEERIASIFRAGESRREYSEQVAAIGRESRASRALSIYRKGG